MVERGTVAWLEEWYGACLKVDAKRAPRLTIETGEPGLNRGWSVRIDLRGTRFAGLSTHSVEHDVAEYDWITASLMDDQFQGHGDETKLSGILAIFRGWVEAG